MLIISEYKLDQNTINNYLSKGFRVAYGYEKNVYPHKGETVGYLLDTMYKSSIERIEYYLYTKHSVVLKYKNKNYRVDTLDEWKHSYREQGKVKYKKHELLIEYECKRRDYLDELDKLKNKQKIEDFLEQYNTRDIPQDLDLFLDTFSRLYRIDVDMTSETDKIKCYNQINTYMDLGLTYLEDNISNAYTLEGQEFMYSNCIASDETIFSSFQFKQAEDIELIDIETYGNEIYLEDVVYKERSE